MLLPRRDTATATVPAGVVAVLIILILRTVTPFDWLDPIVKGIAGAAIVTLFAEWSATPVGEGPTIVTVAWPRTVTASEYVPARTETVGMPLFWAATKAALIAVNCPDPSAATVMADLEPAEVAEEVVEGVGVTEEAERRVVLSTDADSVALEALLWAAASPRRAATTNERIASDDQFEREWVTEKWGEWV
jgi:hypothetical protein